MGVKVEQIKKKPNTRPAQHSSRIFSGRAGRVDQGWINKRCPREMRLSDTRWVIGSITTLLPVLAATNFIITTDELQPHSTRLGSDPRSAATLSRLSHSSDLYESQSRKLIDGANLTSILFMSGKYPQI